MDLITYGEYYNKAMEGIVDMLMEIKNPMASMKKTSYPSAFESYMYKYAGVIDAIEKVYQEEENPQKWMDKLSDRLITAVQRELDLIPKKNKKMDAQLDFNMVLAMYVIPAILEKKGQSADPFTDYLVEKWNAAFKTSVGKATYEKIEGGFHRKLCYITTAVCESQGKADDCYELETLRTYRDEYLLSSEEGKAVVEEYYNIAPTIVNRIRRAENSSEIYEEIYKAYLSPCIKLIESGENEACKERYMDMVMELKGRYMA